MIHTFVADIERQQMENTVRILLVEDSRLIRRENQSALLAAGYDVICAEDGEMALKMTREFAPDLILLDMIIPKINGPEVLKILKKDPKTYRIPVVVVSSLSEKNRDKLVEFGAEDYLEKNELMPSRGVNRLPELLAPIVSRIQNISGGSASPTPCNPVEPDDEANEIEEIVIEDLEALREGVIKELENMKEAE